jgi:hypothetical protein
LGNKVTDIQLFMEQFAEPAPEPFAKPQNLIFQSSFLASQLLPLIQPMLTLQNLIDREFPAFNFDDFRVRRLQHPPISLSFFNPILQQPKFPIKILRPKTTQTANNLSFIPKIPPLPPLQTLIPILPPKILNPTPTPPRPLPTQHHQHLTKLLPGEDEVQ